MSQMLNRCARPFFLPFLILFLCLSLASCDGGSSGTRDGDGSGSGGGGTGGIELPGGGGGGGPGNDTPGGVTPNDGGALVGGTDGGGTFGSGGGGTGGTGGGGGGTSGSIVDVNVNPRGGRTFESYSGLTAPDGSAVINLALQSTTSFQVVSDVGGLAVVTLYLRDPADSFLLDAFNNSPSKTDGLKINLQLNVLPYPTRGADPAVTDGTYSQTLGIYETPNSPFNGTVIAKSDGDLNNGNLRVNIFLVGDHAQGGTVKSAIQAAAALWEDIYETIGITLNFEFIDLPSGTGIVPNPFVGSIIFLNANFRPGVQSPALNVFIGEFISNDGSDVAGNENDEALGIAPSVPGAAIRTSKSAVAVSLSLHEGVDGNLDNDEIRVLGETLAHEAGHYLGLYHPVECANVSCTNYTSQDPLGDTGTCTDLNGCVSNGLVANVLFPTAVPGVAQQDLSGDQGRVLNLQAIVD